MSKRFETRIFDIELDHDSDLRLEYSIFGEPRLRELKSFQHKVSKDSKMSPTLPCPLFDDIITEEHFYDLIMGSFLSDDDRVKLVCTEMY